MEMNSTAMRATRVKINWHPGLSIYASKSFLKLVADEYGWIGGINDSGKLRCILPYTVIKKAIFRMVRFRVETIPLGEEFKVEEERSFLNSAVDYLRSNGADMIIPAATNTIFRTYPYGAVVAPYGTYIIDLRQSEEKLWSELHPNHRNKVRQAMKKGVKIRNGLEYINTAYELIRNTFKKSKLGFMGHNEFSRLVLGLGENVKVFIAYYQGVIQGCLVVPFSDFSAYALHSGRIPEIQTGAMNLLRWEAIRHFRGLGVKYFDSVGVRINPEKGSKQEGLMAFKKRFGGQLVQGYMWKYPFHSLKYAVYSLAVRLQRGGDIVDQERHKLNLVGGSRIGYPLPTERLVPAR